MGPINETTTIGLDIEERVIESKIEERVIGLEIKQKR